MKHLVLLTSLAFSFAAANAAPPVEGEYQCDGCHGYMTVKKNSNATYQLWLGVGGGSCGGEIFAKDDFKLSPEGRFLIPRRVKGKKCTTEIQIEGKNAYVSDSCISPNDEAGSTCAVLGEYTKHDKAR